MGGLLPELVRGNARRCPERVALVLDGVGRLTYGELAERADAVSAGLAGRGVRPGDLVALVFPNSAWLDYAVALFGVFGCGAAAVVVSSGATGDELRHIAGHCDLRAVLADRPAGLPEVAGWCGDLAAVRADGPAPAVGAAADDLALVLHTSGTTGRPKGVPITQGQLAVPATQSAPKADPGVAERMFTPFPVASTAGQMMLALELGRGNTVYLLPEFDADRFCALVDGELIDRVNLAPAMGHWLVRSGRAASTVLRSPSAVMFSSAPLPVSVLGEMRALFPNARLQNLYSSTELAPGVVTTDVDPARPASVGKPADAFELRITDAAGDAVPPGGHGEVRMRVPGLAGRRYLGDDAASARTFDGDWVRTGDLGYLDAEGYLYLVDRESDVLNPGGRKVAPSEVEAVLAGHPAVLECAVFGLPHPVLDQLVAAAVVAGSPVTAPELKRFAADRLSDYKVPAAVYFVESLPRNEIGKVQRAKLAALIEPSGAPVALGDTERRLAGMWRELLELPADPDGSANFFAVGGHSLAIARLVREITDEFGVTPRVRGLFEHATLTEQAAHLDTLAGPERPARRRLERLPDGDIAPWSYLQEYLWSAKRECPNPGWNVLLTVRLHGPLDLAAVRGALTFLVRRHEVLRTRLDEAGQRVDVPAPVDLPVTDAATPAGLAAICRVQHSACVDLRHGPALLARLARVSAGEHVLLLTMDHASCDGWSAGIILREFAAAYDALAGGGEPELPPLPVRYRDVAAHQRALVAEGAFDAELAYWRRALAGLPAGPLLPHRPDAPAGPGFHSGQRLLDLGPELAAAVRRFAAATDHTVFMVLLGALAAALAEVSGRTDVAVAALSAGRADRKVQGVVGMFANPLLLRVDVAAAGSYRELFAAAHAAVAGAHEHEAVPFPVVADRVGGSAGRPEVWFNMAPPISPPRAERIRPAPSGIARNYPIEVPAAGWRGENLLVNGMDDGETISLEFDHNTVLVDAATIERLCAAYLAVLHAVAT